MKLRNLIGLVAAAAVVQCVLAVGGERDVSLAGPGWRFAKDPTCELRFTSIRFDGANLQVTLDKPAHLQVITKRGVTAWANANKISFSVASSDREKYGYLRIRAYARDDSGEIIFSQPLMLT